MIAPKNGHFMSPIQKSRKFIEPSAERRKNPHGIPNCQSQMIIAPEKPITSASAPSTGITITHEISRGTTSFFIGSAPSARSGKLSLPMLRVWRDAVERTAGTT